MEYPVPPQSCDELPALAQPDGAAARRPPATGAGGAQPSNTAPPKYIAPFPQVVRVLRAAVDSLYVSFKGTLGPSRKSQLEDLKCLAQDMDPAQQSLAQIQIGDRVFAVAPQGRGRFRFLLKHPDFALQVSLGVGYPLATVQVSSEFLAQVSPEAALREVRYVVNCLGPTKEQEIVSRLDLAVDFTPDMPLAMFPVEHWVTRAVEIEPHFSRGVFTGWSIGRGGALSARLYDKVTEIFQKSRKGHWFELWSDAGYTPGEPVWRLEFQLRREVLQELGAGAVAEAVKRLPGLWTYAMEWLSLRSPTDDENRSRWPVAPLWSQLTKADWGTAAVRLKRRRRAGIGAFDRRAKQLMGLLTSNMAEHGVTDVDQGIEAFLEEFAGLARSMGTTTARYVEDRARAKACRLNMINNRRELGVPDREYELTADEYREIKDGE